MSRPSSRTFMVIIAPRACGPGYTAAPKPVPALTFVVDRRHVQYAGKLSPAEAARTIRGARGRSGANPDYLANTIAHLNELGIPCPGLGEIQRLINQDN